MGSLLPGWDCPIHEESMGFKEELHTETELAAAAPIIGKRRHSTSRKSVEVQQAYVPELNTPPDLARKSAPSSVYRQMQAEDKRTPGNRVHENAETKRVYETLYARDKWWQKFSSANLNDRPKDVETESRIHSYVPQFGLAGGDVYIKHP